MFITSDFYQDQQDSCLAILGEPFKVAYEFQSISIAFLYECLKICSERASDSVCLVCTSADKSTWHRGDAQCLLVESIIECVIKIMTLVLWTN